MRASLLSLGVLVLLEACSASGPRRSEISEADLLSGSVLGPGMANATAPSISMADALALDDDMRAFVRGIGDASQSTVKVNRLLAAMKRRGLLSLDYNDATTHTASATFHERQGNCLSFTMLFVALARGVGLHASFQLVEVPPQWSRDLDLVVVNSHVNSIVVSSFDRDVVVDFNAARFGDDYRTRKIDDRYAAALYFSNSGAEALLHRDYAASLAFLREAVRIRDDIAGPWVNIGVLYGRQGRYDYAEAAYLRALEADPSEHSALANLVGVYTALGNEQLAEEYRTRVRHYQDINPYYHFDRAQKAYDESRFEDALVEVRRAIRLKDDEGDFYSLRGRALVALGHDDGAAASFRQASVHARPDALVREIETRTSSAPGRLPHSSDTLDTRVSRPSPSGTRPSIDSFGFTVFP